MKKIAITAMLVLFVIVSIAQPQIQFDNTTYDFGNIKEEAGPTTGRFEFTNTGNEDLLLVRVAPGCGCTAANYTREAVPPGGRGFIDATYNPLNRPGNFHKSIRVTINTPVEEGQTATPIMLFIKGFVEKRPPTKYELAGYKEGTGNVRIKERYVRLETKSSTPLKYEVFIKNFNDKATTVTPLSLPSYIKVETSFKKELKADQEGIITITFDPKAKDQIGNVREVITFETQDTVEPKFTLFMDINVVEDFSTYTPEQLKKAPVAVLSSDLIQFGNVAKSTQLSQTVKLTNSGKSALHIRQIKPSSAMYTVKMDKSEILPGDFATLTITFNARTRAGAQPATIDIITNDPKNPTLTFKVEATILE